MKEVIYKCNGIGCEAVRSGKSDFYAVMVEEGRIVIKKFTEKLADKNPIFCGANCLHVFLSTKIRELLGSDDDNP